MYQWYVRIDGVWEEMHGPGARSRFWITGYINGKFRDFQDRKYDSYNDPKTLRRVYG